MSTTMSHLQSSKREEAEFTGSCSSGGTWYACAEGSTSNFVGCCATDPCSTGCSQGNIKPVSFDVGLNFTLPDASCGSSSDFYTCNSGTKTFWGCCKSNPCRQEQVCPSGDLVPAFMERKEQFLTYAGESNTTSTSITSTGAADPSATGRPQSSHTVAIIAGAVGGVLGLAILVAVLIFCLRKRKNRGRKKDSMKTDFPFETTPMTEKVGHRESTLTDAPPVYTSPNPSTYPPSPSIRAHNRPPSQDIQELPAELWSPSSKTWNPNRHSELPAGLSLASPGSPDPSVYSEPPTSLSPTTERSPNPSRFSELAADGPRLAELESPAPSPKPRQSAFGSESA